LSEKKSIRVGDWIQSMKTGRRGQVYRIKKLGGNFWVTYCVIRRDREFPKSELLENLVRIDDPEFVTYSVAPLWRKKEELIEERKIEAKKLEKKSKGVRRKKKKVHKVSKKYLINREVKRLKDVSNTK